MSKLAFLACLFTLGAVTLSGCALRTVPVAAATPARSPNDLQCHTEKVTGSLLKTQVCLTKAQRDARAVAAQQMKDILQNHQNLGCLAQADTPCKH
jgi:hypothetical protein